MSEASARLLKNISKMSIEKQVRFVYNADEIKKIGLDKLIAEFTKVQAMPVKDQCEYIFNKA